MSGEVRQDVWLFGNELKLYDLTKTHDSRRKKTIRFLTFTMRLEIRRSLLNLLLISGPILLGFSIYFSCRSSTLLYYQWIPYKKNLAVEAVKAYAGGGM